MSLPGDGVKPELAAAIVDKMLATDGFAHWLGVENFEATPGRSVIRMKVRPEMVNGHGGVHGAVVYSLADIAFSFAINSTGIISVGIDCSVNYPAAVQVGDVLTAVGVFETSSRRLAFCGVTVSNQDDVIVGHFRGTGYRTLKPHFPEAAE